MDATDEIKRYIDEKRELRDLLITYLENSDDCTSDFKELVEFAQKQKFEQDREEFEHFLHLVLCISNNFHREPDFWEKIEKIIQYFSDTIKQTFSNFEIFNFFSENKRILLFLIETKILQINEIIISNFIQKVEFDKIRYCHFFYPQIKSFIKDEMIQKIEKELLDYSSNIFENFEEKQKNGENESYICTLIRNDSVEDFIIYITQNNVSLFSQITPSLFETNSFLIGQKPSLIEYTAFYGSIEIFKYLYFNRVELEPSLWLYIIHSKNPELIHFLEENDIFLSDKSYSKCLLETIKCHHNDVANYIFSSLTSNFGYSFLINKLRNEDYYSVFCYDNYAYFPYDFDDDASFNYIVQYQYNKLVNFHMIANEKDIERKYKIKQKKNFFLNEIPYFKFLIAFYNQF